MKKFSSASKNVFTMMFLLILMGGMVWVVKPMNTSASVSRETFTITLDLNGGVIARWPWQIFGFSETVIKEVVYNGDDGKTIGAWINYINNAYSNPIKKGYIFQDWVCLTTNVPIWTNWNYIISSDFIFTAQWKPVLVIKDYWPRSIETIIITFNLNGGSYHGNTDNVVRIVENFPYGVFNPYPSLIKKEGYVHSRFLQWRTSDGQIFFPDRLRGDITLYAEWYRGFYVSIDYNGGYRILYDDDGQIMGIATLDTTRILTDHSERRTINDFINHNRAHVGGLPIRENYIFNGWHFEGDGDDYLDEHLLITAQWVPVRGHENQQQTEPIATATPTIGQNRANNILIPFEGGFRGLAQHEVLHGRVGQETLIGVRAFVYLLAPGVADTIQWTSNVAPITTFGRNHDGDWIQFTFTVGSTTAQIGPVDGTVRNIILSSTPVVLNGRIFLPVSVVADVFGFTVTRTLAGYSFY